jgi:hypothetical protein
MQLGDTDFDEVVADGGVTAAMVIRKEALHMASIIDRVVTSDDANGASEPNAMALCTRLTDRANDLRESANNSRIVEELLQPQLDLFSSRGDYNQYAARLALNHRRSAKDDDRMADDIMKAVMLIRKYAA